MRKSLVTPWRFSLSFQGKYAESERLYERSQAIREKALDPDHPHVATVLSNRANLSNKQVKGRQRDLEKVLLYALYMI